MENDWIPRNELPPNKKNDKRSNLTKSDSFIPVPIRSPSGNSSNHTGARKNYQGKSVFVPKRSEPNALSLSTAEIPSQAKMKEAVPTSLQVACNEAVPPSSPSAPSVVSSVDPEPKIKMVFAEYLSSHDDKEAVLCLTDLKKQFATHMMSSKFFSVFVDEAMAQDSHSRELFYKLFLTILQEEVLNSSDLEAGFSARFQMGMETKEGEKMDNVLIVLSKLLSRAILKTKLPFSCLKGLLKISEQSLTRKQQLQVIEIVAADIDEIVTNPPSLLSLWTSVSQCSDQAHIFSFEFQDGARYLVISGSTDYSDLVASYPELDAEPL